jgi:hypothetical protein
MLLRGMGEKGKGTQALETSELVLTTTSVKKQALLSLSTLVTST